MWSPSLWKQGAPLCALPIFCLQAVPRGRGRHPTRCLSGGHRAQVRGSWLRPGVLSSHRCAHLTTCCCGASCQVGSALRGCAMQHSAATPTMPTVPLGHVGCSLAPALPPSRSGTLKMSRTGSREPEVTSPAILPAEQCGLGSPRCAVAGGSHRSRWPGVSFSCLGSGWLNYYQH